MTDETDFESSLLVGQQRSPGHLPVPATQSFLRRRRDWRRDYGSAGRDGVRGQRTLESRSRNFEEYLCAHQRAARVDSRLAPTLSHWESGSPYLYLRTTSEGRIIVGGEDEDFVNAKRRDALISQKTRTLVKKFGRLFPDLKLEVAYAWAGTFGESKDGLAYIGVHPLFPHCYSALGYGGNGITYSIIAAELIRDQYLGRSNHDAQLFRFGR